MDDCSAGVIFYGICGESIAGGGCVLSECRSDIQMHSGISGIPLWELDTEADAGYIKNVYNT